MAGVPFVDLGPIESLERYIYAVHAIRRRWSKGVTRKRRAEDPTIWFRGQRDWNFGLSPKLYRKEFAGADEAEIRLEFESQAIQLIPGRLPRDRWEWYFLMQHYRVPTRLLDWTESPMIGLYFALEDQGSDTDAAVWIVDPEWINFRNPYLRKSSVAGAILSDWKEAEPYLRTLEDAFAHQGVRVRYPAAIEPPHVDRRVAAQSSRFIVFGTAPDLAKTDWRKAHVRLAKFRIPLKHRARIYEDLLALGVTPFSVFPDLEGLSANIQDRWRKFK